MSDQILSINLVEKFEQADKWPTIPSEVPERPLAEEEQVEVEAHIELGKAVIRELVGDVDTKHTHRPYANRDYYATREYAAYEFLEDVLLRGARTPEQVQNMVAGYIYRCIDGIRDEKVRSGLIEKLPEELRLKFEPFVPFSRENMPDIDERHRLNYNNVHITASIGHWPRLRHADFFVLDNLSLAQHRRYAYEPNHDGFQTIATDAFRVFTRHSSSSQGVDTKGLIRRDPPESKRMTPEKFSRLVQLPGLQDYIDADTDMEDEAICSNLTLIAEYFCENDDVLYKNKITKEDIDTWMREKFEKHTPQLHVAIYVWTRFLGTEFEDTALWIEQYMLDLLEKDEKWIFDIAQMKREECTEPNSLFVLYDKAITAAEISPDADRSNKIYKLIPAAELLEAAMGSKNYKDSNEVKAIYDQAKHPYLYLPEKYTEERYENDFDGFCLDLFQEALEPLSEWVAIEGFELLDPTAIDGYSSARGWQELLEVLKKTEKKIQRLAPVELLKFKRDVVEKLPDPFKDKAMRIITDIAEKWTVETSFDGHDTNEVADMAMGENLENAPELILPGGLPLDSFLGTGGSKKRLQVLAERAVLRRCLKGVRGEDEIIQYLLRHRDTMIPIELVTPTPEAPNKEIIEEFGSSPDLLSLLSVATLLVYLGYEYDQVMAEVRMQAELAELENHPDITTIGVEYEQVGATPEGTIVNQTRYSWLFNVLAMGGDSVANEIKTAPTVSTFMQKYLFSLVTNPKFQFINAQMLWEIAARKDRAPSSLHLNIAVPKELPFSEDLVRKYMAPVQDMQWLANGGKAEQQSGSRGYVRDWKRGALLDVLEDKHERHRLEIRNMSLDKEGDYNKQMDMLQLLGSAAIQFMREKAGIKLSPSGRVLAQMYEQFRRESLIVLKSSGDGNTAIAARILMEKFTDLIRSELNRPKVEKKEGIVMVG